MNPISSGRTTVRSRNAAIGVATLLGLATMALRADDTKPNLNGVRITRADDRLRVELNGKFFTEYYYTNVPRPFCYPIIGPSGMAMTRNYPMTNAPGEEQDHPHHRSLWVGAELVNGNDLWTERNVSGHIVHRGFADIASGANVGHIKTLNDWVDAKGNVLCTDEETLRFYTPTDDSITLDFEITLKASQGDVTFGDSKDAFFATRVAESMRVLLPAKKGAPAQPGQGHIVLSTGVRDDGASAAAAKDAKREAISWGKQADWCDYYGPVNSNLIGIAIMDHPSNPRHPTWWHVRDYGLFAANPFGRHHFENLSDKQAGDFKITAGQSATFRYRVVWHNGDEKTARIAARYADYVKDSPTKTK